MKSEIFEIQKMVIALFKEFCRSLCSAKPLKDTGAITINYHYCAYVFWSEYRLVDIPH